MQPQQLTRKTSYFSRILFLKKGKKFKLIDALIDLFQENEKVEYLENRV